MEEKTRNEEALAEPGTLKALAKAHAKFIDKMREVKVRALLCCFKMAVGPSRVRFGL